MTLPISYHMDTLLWGSYKKGNFHVKSVYYSIRQLTTNTVNDEVGN